MFTLDLDHSFYVAFIRTIMLNEYIYTHVTVLEKTRYKSKIAILDNVHLKVQTLCYFMLKSGWLDGDKITSVGNNAVLFSAFCSSRFILISYADT